MDHLEDWRWNSKHLPSAKTLKDLTASIGGWWWFTTILSCYGPYWTLISLGQSFWQILSCRFVFFIHQTNPSHWFRVRVGPVDEFLLAEFWMESSPHSLQKSSTISNSFSWGGSFSNIFFSLSPGNRPCFFPPEKIPVVNFKGLKRIASAGRPLVHLHLHWYTSFLRWLLEAKELGNFIFIFWKQWQQNKNIYIYTWCVYIYVCVVNHHLVTFFHQVTSMSGVLQWDATLHLISIGVTDRHVAQGVPEWRAGG